ncbi:response regulator transcription factor [soil metagenome]
MTPRVLLIDDDARLAAMVGDYLRASGMQIETAGSLAAGRQLLAASGFGLSPSSGGSSAGSASAPSQQPGHGPGFAAVVLDLMLPDGDGLDLCRELRANPRTRTLPLLMLSARGEPLDRIVGLELGADDYLAKPFEPRELLARVKALLRRAATVPDTGEVLRFGRLEIDLAERAARLDGNTLDLTSHQFDLLVVLAQNPGRVMSRDHIMDALKGHPLEAFDRSIDVHISRIRALIETDPKTPRRVLTVRGAGYLFARKQDADSSDSGDSSEAIGSAP